MWQRFEPPARGGCQYAGAARMRQRAQVASIPVGDTNIGFLYMKNKAIKFGIIASILPHLFCCVLPIVLSIISLFAPEVAHAEIVPHWVEPWLFVFSGLMLCVSWYLVFRDCHCDCEHCHDEHGHNHRTQKIIVAVITVIFIISVILHLIAHH